MLNNGGVGEQHHDHNHDDHYVDDHYDKYHDDHESACIGDQFWMEYAQW
jgi:hypothetical protein